MEAPLVSIYDQPPPSRGRLAWWRFIERHLPVLVIYLLVATLVAVVYDQSPVGRRYNDALEASRARLGLEVTSTVSISPVAAAEPGGNPLETKSSIMAFRRSSGSSAAFQARTPSDRSLR